jgi:hypothetical protein
MPKIRQLDNQRPKEVSLVPQPGSGFVMPCVGSTGDGKSTALDNMLIEKEFYKQKYNRIILISSNAELDEKTALVLNMHDICVSNQALQDAQDDEIINYDPEHERTKLPRFHGIDPEDVHEEYDPLILKQLMESQKKVIKMWGKKLADTVLVCIDDAITSGAYWESAKGRFAKFACGLRHVKTDLIHCTQQWKSVPKVIRTQSTCGVLCGIPNDLELKDLYENFAAGYPLHKWSEIYSVIVNKEFQPFVVNLRNPRGSKLQKAFEEFVG